MVEDWSRRRLLDLVALPSGQVDPRLSPYGGLPLLAPNHVQSGTGRWTHVETASQQDAISGKYLFEPGDVVYSKIRPYLRKATLARRAGLCSADMYPLRPGPDIDGRFLLEVLLSDSFTVFATQVSSRTGIPKINREELGEFWTTLPPLPEQRKIAAILSSVDETIEKTEAVIEQLQVAKKAMMEELLTRGIPGRHKRFKKTEIGEIPEEWEVLPLPSLANYQNGRAFPSSDYGDDGVRLVRPGNLHADGIVEWDGRHTTHLPSRYADENPEFLVGRGELLMNLTAQSLEDAFLGRVCLTPPGEPCLLNQRIARLRPFTADIHFLFWVLSGPHFRRHVDRLPQGSKVKHLYNRDLDAAWLPIPHPDEQRAIAAVLDAVRSCVTTERRALETARTMKSALSGALLSGDLRVTPDEDAA